MHGIALAGLAPAGAGDAAARRRRSRRIRSRSTPTASSTRRRQRALTRYYLDAGAGGLAVGVHTTQFAIRDVGLYRPVLELAMRSAAEWAKSRRS